MDNTGIPINMPVAPYGGGGKSDGADGPDYSGPYAYGLRGCAMFDGICEALHRELDTIDNKLMGGKAPMSSQDLDNIDKMAHALKSLATYDAMRGERRSYSRYENEYRRY